ncbi:bifunctional heptose 7-phosphate kinase/heptose 1-phosphate adenyltransferase [Bacillus sp. T33-2]|uniref:bifunctional heptose 7-phosphate kinase/heptose 1-phosphate adenyltransferase n=1 Tax=Bacillus sp. T33-2 TaxID=2054168 RepID=UPI0015E0BC5F|nr:PfkB family carbohydrate kinase [Bacillus sp. T33-2]
MVRADIHKLNSKESTLTQTDAERILANFPKLKIGVIGDACLDIYWHADMRLSELSRETPHYPLPVVREIHSPGAAGNVAANLVDLGAGTVYLCTIFGNDWRGTLLQKDLEDIGVRLDYTVLDQSFITPTYCKPILIGHGQSQQEAPRLDFYNYETMAPHCMEFLLEKFDLFVQAVDIVAVSDQLKNGIVVQEIKDRMEYWADRGKVFVVDSRERIATFRNVIVKPNEVEIMNWSIQEERDKTNELNLEDYLDAGFKLSEQIKGPCCLTLGDRGTIWFNENSHLHIPPLHVTPPTDIVGAGDSFLSGFVSVLGSGHPGNIAAEFAQYCSAVVIKKLGQTGTASPREIVELFSRER